MGLYDVILALKKGNKDYDQALEDAVAAIRKSLRSCKIVHKKTGLFFNGYKYSARDMHVTNNTLSTSSSVGCMVKNRTDQEILENAFTTIEVENELHMVNHIINPGSKIHTILSEHYEEYRTIPVSDFIVDHS